MAFDELFSSFDSKWIADRHYNTEHEHWGFRVTNTRRCELYKTVLKFDGLFISGGQPSYWPMGQNKIPDLLDFFITRNV